MGRFVRGMLLGLLMVFAVGVWPAHARVDHAYTKVTTPGSGSVLRGFYESDGTPKAFKHTIRGQAKTDCPDLSSIKFSVTGADGYSVTFPTIDPSPGSNSATWSGGPSDPWDTQDLKLNGVYSVRMTATDRDTLLCEGNESFPTKVDVKVANAPVAPEWSASPAAAADRSAAVSLTWKKNPEPDVVNYHITRTGPGGSVTAIAPASVCGASTCQAEDRSFPAEYSGTYSYQITTYRSAPAGTGDPCASGSSDECVKSNGSDIKPVTLTKPTPSPSPSSSPTKSPSSFPSASSGGNNRGPGSTPTSSSRGGSSVLSFGSGSSSNDFYSGTYDESLPYQPKSLVLGGGQTTPANGRDVEAAAFSEEPPNYRTIMLPVAGGLLAFLSAAHVRRLLIHF